MFNWLKNLFKKKDKVSVINNVVNLKPTPKPIDPVKPIPELNEPVWFKWFMDRYGWTEFNHDKELSKGWKYTNCKSYKSVIGSDNAWCAMSLCTALEENGYKSSNDAAAVSFKNYGTACDYVKGAIIVIRHSSGAHHVTLFNTWVESGKIMLCTGGNQSNAINTTKFNVSGNNNGCDQVVACRWPIKK